MAPPLLTLQQICLGFGAAPVLDNIDLVIPQRCRLALVGRNGSGKSTLMRILAGLTEADSGQRFLQPGSQIAYLSQAPDFGAAATLADYLATGTTAHPTADHLLPAAHDIEAALADMQLDPAAAPQHLSGGEQRRANLARVFLHPPDLLLLDEPTNHLDLPTILRLEARLQAYNGALVLISHDRAFLRALTQSILWLDRGQLRRLDQGFAAFNDWADRLAAEEAEARHKRDRKLLQETRWSREGISARRKRNQGRLRRLAAMREARAKERAQTGQAKAVLQSGALSGKRVIEAENLHKRLGGRILVRDFSARILRGDRIGIIGANGAGKTTLVRLLCGDLAPDQGTVHHGTGLRPQIIDQQRRPLEADISLADFLTDGRGDQIHVNGQPRHVASYLRDYLFDGAQAQMSLRALSGGERNRLILAKAFANPSNFLVLDEPTNDLDVETLELLQEILADYTGTLLLVSHDRDFLDAVVTATFAMEGDGRVDIYPGGYETYRQQRPHQPPVPAPVKMDRKTKPSRPDKTPKPARLGYQRERELARLPAEIEALQDDIAGLSAALGDPDLYQRDPGRYQDLSDQLANVQALLAEKENRWLELELLREEGGG